ncbi:UPF0051 protein slr0074 [Durusdinium trenchii]|uniref:cysteine desulfurase n=1 Tax=Durusdinium trenchii TaxID=1381693 RepID=A0ABP0LS76_9DINO
MSIYLTVQVKIKDRDAYDRYAAAFMDVFVKFKGKMLAADFNPKVVDGEWDMDRLVLMSFPDEESLMAWITSKEYQAISADRKAGADTIALMAQGIEAFHRWLTMEEPTWAMVDYPEIDYQDAYYYAEPKSGAKYESLDDVPPEILADFEKLGIPLREAEVLLGVEGAGTSPGDARTHQDAANGAGSKVAVDAVFDSVSVATTFKKELEKAGVIFMSISEAVREHPELVKKYLGTVVPTSDNFFATLNSAVFSDGTFVYVPEGVRCPMELSTYFRINEANTGQFERTLIVAAPGSYVSYLEGCTAPMRDENQLHAAVVELVVEDDAEIKYSTVQNWYPGDKDGKGGIYNFVTKRADCRGVNSKVSWTQVETGSAVTWKYPSCVLKGDNSQGEFYSIAITNNHQQADTGTKMIHLGKNTKSRVISKGISAGQSNSTYRGISFFIANSAAFRKRNQLRFSLMRQLGGECRVMKKPVLNINDAEFMDFGSPNGKFQAKLGRLGPAIGAEKLGAMLTVVEPGKRAFPFHAHHAIEELFFIIEGSGEYRFGEETYAVAKGDLLAAPTGGANRAHQIVNTGQETLKYLAVSTMDNLDIVEYPDSDKYLAFASEDGSPQTARMRVIGRQDAQVGYFDGWKGEQVCELLQETEQLRVLRCTFPPGVGHERHYHTAHFGYVIEGGLMRITDGGGTREQEFAAGVTWTSDGVEWHEALNIGLSLDVPAGEVHAIMGPNGSGKSTLSYTVAGREDYEATDGEVTLNDESILDLSPDERAAKGLFLSFQHPMEIPGVQTMTFIRTAVNAQRRARGEDEISAADFIRLIREKGKLVGLNDAKLKRPFNVGFSGGEKKRMEMLQMAMFEPQFAIMDETDSGLDIDALKMVGEVVNALRGPDRGFLVITHYQRLLEYIKPDAVHVLADGRIVKSGGLDLAAELEKSGYDQFIEVGSSLTVIETFEGHALLMMMRSFIFVSEGCQNKKRGRLRSEFPILQRAAYGKRLVYLDNAASAQKPQAVIDAMTRAMEYSYANVHRGLHLLSNEATAAFENARKTAARFLNAASDDEIIFTSGGTDAFNLVSYALGANEIGEGDEIILSLMEHHSNIVPWHLLRERKGVVLKWLDVSEDGEIDLDAYRAMFTSHTKLVAVSHMSNVLGALTPAKDMTRIAHEHGVKILFDGCQGAVHGVVDVQDIGCDFYVMTGHKLYGPTGIGVLYGKMSALKNLPPFKGGGEMIDIVTTGTVTYNDPPHRFEAGTPPILEAIGLGAALAWMKEKGVDAIAAHEARLRDHALEELAKLNFVRVYGRAGDKAPIIAFTVEGAHPHDISAILDRTGVAVRAGHHCAQPLMKHLGVSATARASFAAYNTHEDVEALIAGLHKAQTSGAASIPEEELARITADVIKGLKSVYDPEIPVDIYELGLIYKVDLSDDRLLTVDMTLTAPGCPVAGEMPGWVEGAVRGIEGVEDVKVEMTFDPPWTPEKMSDEAKLELGWL